MKKTRQLYSGAHGTVLLTLPKQALEALKSKVGDTVVLVIKDGKVEIRKLEL